MDLTYWEHVPSSSPEIIRKKAQINRLSTNWNNGSRVKLTTRLDAGLRANLDLLLFVLLDAGAQAFGSTIAIEESTTATEGGEAGFFHKHRNLVRKVKLTSSGVGSKWDIEHGCQGMSPLWESRLIKDPDPTTIDRKSSIMCSQKRVFKAMSTYLVELKSKAPTQRK